MPISRNELPSVNEGTSSQILCTTAIIKVRQQTYLSRLHDFSESVCCLIRVVQAAVVLVQLVECSVGIVA